MFEDVYDGVISALSKSGFLNWEMGEFFSNPRFKSPITYVNYNTIDLPKTIKLIKYNYSGADHTPTTYKYPLKDLN